VYGTAALSQGALPREPRQPPLSRQFSARISSSWQGKPPFISQARVQSSMRSNGSRSVSTKHKLLQTLAHPAVAEASPVPPAAPVPDVPAELTLAPAPPVSPPSSVVLPHASATESSSVVPTRVKLLQFVKRVGTRRGRLQSCSPRDEWVGPVALHARLGRGRWWCFDPRGELYGLEYLRRTFAGVTFLGWVRGVQRLGQPVRLTCDRDVGVEKPSVASDYRRRGQERSALKGELCER